MIEVFKEYEFYAAYAALIIVMVVFAWHLWFAARLRRFFSGASGRDLEGVIDGMKRELGELKNKHREVAEYIAAAEPRLKKSIKHVGMVRFNSFQDIGGQQSFSVALLDENRDGVVISSLYGREGNRVYAKTIVKGEPQFKLAPEEEEAIKLAYNR